MRSYMVYHGNMHKDHDYAITFSTGLYQIYSATLENENLFSENVISLLDVL